MSTERGRPRSFDPETVLAQALGLFWRHGYQGVSYRDLTEATGLTKPSLYAAFGDKEALYLRCLDQYLEAHLRGPVALLQGPGSRREALARFLQAMVDLLTDPDQPGGCFLFTGILGSGGSDRPEAVDAALHRARQRGEGQLRRHLQAAQREGELALDADPSALATTFTTLLAGLALQARNGVGRARLRQVAAGALAFWPRSAPAVHRR